MRLTFGGEASGDMPTHYLPPGMQGFDEAGGLDGQGLDVMAQPRGDLDLAAEYFRKAGYAAGRYDGDEPLLMVGENQGVRAKAAEVAQQQFERLGFHVRLRRFSTGTMFTEFCGVPSAHVAICPTVGWVKDFGDAQTFLDPTFNGENISATGNSNYSQLDDPDVNERMRAAKQLTDPSERAHAWADIDGQITALAPAIPWLWPKQANIRSENVVGTIDEYTGVWSLAYTRLR
jgi:peptide/nickel transport system substrate-binding protein